MPAPEDPSTLQVRATLACCVANFEERSMVHRAAPDRVPVADIHLPGDLANLNHYVGLVYDLEPRDERAVKILRAARQLAPLCPFLLYIPEWPWLFELVQRAEVNSLVRIHIPKSGKQEETELKKDLGMLLREAVVAIVMHCIALLSAPRLTPVKASYMWEVGRWLINPPEHKKRPTVRRMAARLRTSAREIERKWDADRLPKPKELLDWSLLLFAELAPCVTGMARGELCQTLGLTRQGLYRLRQRLARRVQPLTAPGPGQDFARALAASILRHGTPVSPVLRTLHAACGWIAVV